MAKLPVLPTSVLLSREHHDVFLSFHFEGENAVQVVIMCEILETWIQELLKEFDAVAVNVLREVPHG